jgi:hypothetical protein
LFLLRHSHSARYNRPARNARPPIPAPIPIPTLAPVDMPPGEVAAAGVAEEFGVEVVEERGVEVDEERVEVDEGVDEVEERDVEVELLDRVEDVDRTVVDVCDELVLVLDVEVPLVEVELEVGEVITALFDEEAELLGDIAAELVDENENTGVLVYRSPLTPIIVRAFPDGIMDVPLPDSQSQLPFSAAGVQQNEVSEHCVSDPSLSSRGSSTDSESVSCFEIQEAKLWRLTQAIIATRIFIPLGIGTRSSHHRSQRNTAGNHAWICRNAFCILETRPTFLTANGSFCKVIARLVVGARILATRKIT